MSTKKIQILGNLGEKIYKQNEEPIDAPDGTLWIDMDESDNSTHVLKIKNNGVWEEIAGGAGSMEIDDIITLDIDNAVEGEPSTINADTLGGRNASEFALNANVEEIRTDIEDLEADIENLRTSINNIDVSTQIDSAMDALRQEILGGEW